jgi:hypothetical protein
LAIQALQAQQTANQASTFIEYRRQDQVGCVNKPYQNRNQGCINKPYYNQDQDQDNKDNNKNENKEREYWYCLKKGHFEKDCYLKRKAEKKYKKKQRHLDKGANANFATASIADAIVL